MKAPLDEERLHRPATAPRDGELKSKLGKQHNRKCEARSGEDSKLKQTGSRCRGKFRDTENTVPGHGYT
ncbi:hypothetical protein EYF80_038226 [Liparis tanakae]|uniref:Uncharacterized protein n=1 Tax=Liparis tanakae TaxID=230148 RepID=A0A4Z2GDE1_9TELE|nr:hypothetical protein EYF80_038226 [Liparis tanakae]